MTRAETAETYIVHRLAKTKVTGGASPVKARRMPAGTASARLSFLAALTMTSVIPTIYYAISPPRSNGLTI